MNIPQELLYQQYVRRELETYRAPYDTDTLEYYKLNEIRLTSYKEDMGYAFYPPYPHQI